MPKNTAQIIHHSSDTSAVEVQVTTDVKVLPSETARTQAEMRALPHSLPIHAQTSQPLPPIKPGYKTSEFWVTIIAQVVGVLTSMGYISPGHATDVSNSINTIVGAVMSILPAIVYIFNRTWLKTKVESDQELR